MTRTALTGLMKSMSAKRSVITYRMPEWIEYGVENTSSEAADAAPPSLQGEGFALNFRILREGCVGEDVKALQLMLKVRGYQCGYYGSNGDGADGEFGAATKKQLISYQRVNGLEPDGEAGPDTMSALLGIK